MGFSFRTVFSIFSPEKIEKVKRREVENELELKSVFSMKYMNILVLIVILIFGVFDSFIILDKEAYRQLNVSRFLFSSFFIIPFIAYYFKSSKRVPPLMLFFNVFGFSLYLTLLSYIAQNNLQALFHNSIGLVLLNMMLFLIYRLKLVYNIILVIFHLVIININYSRSIAISELPVSRTDLLMWFIIVTVLSYFVGRNLREINIRILLSELELRKSSQSRYKLFSIISHDLKNLMASQYSIADYLNDSKNYKEEGDLDKFLNVLYKSTKDALYTFNELMLWMKTQLDEIKPVMKRIEIEKLINHQVNSFQVQSKEKNIQINTKITGANNIIESDLSILGMALRNVIGNAIKFSEKGSEIEINVLKGPSGYRIDVNDSGVGMTKGEMDKLFNSEHLVSSRGTSGESGTGLGLLLTKELLTSINSTINIESKKNEGTSVMINVPTIFSNVN